MRYATVQWLDSVIALTFLALFVVVQGCSSAERVDEAQEVCQLLQDGAGVYSAVYPDRCLFDDELDDFVPPFECASGDGFYDALSEAIRRGNLVFDTDQLEDCNSAASERFEPPRTVAEHHQLMSETLDGIFASESACTALFVGTATEGTPCSVSAECSEGLLCIGESCSPPREIGEQCAVTQNCIEEAYCIIGEVCAARINEGESCQNSRECANGLFCSDDNLCRQPAQSGELCEGDLGCTEVCDVCRPETSGGERRCLQRGALAASCLAHDHCQRGMYCDEEQRCQLISEVGEPCETHDQCDNQIAFCDPDSARCTELRTTGEHCSDSLACQSGLTCEANRCEPSGEIIGEDTDLAGCDFYVDLNNALFTHWIILAGFLFMPLFRRGAGREKE
jgi:hypothetical protein